MATMLALIQRATAEMGLPVPSVVTGNTNQDVMQQNALLNAVGYELQREHQWQWITKEYQFYTQYLETTGDWTTSDGVVTNIPDTSTLAAGTWQVTGAGIQQNTYVQSVDSATQVTLTLTPTASATTGTLNFGQTKYSKPSDYDRQIDRTHFDKSMRWEMIGPESAQQWQWLKSSYISTGPRIRYRILGNTFQVWPIPATNELLGFEYVSSYWVSSSGASAPDKGAFTLDTDTCVFPDTLMVLGLKKKYFEAKGFDVTAYTRDYISELDKAKAMDAGSATLSFSPRVSSVLVGWENIPDSNYGS